MCAKRNLPADQCADGLVSMLRHRKGKSKQANDGDAARDAVLSSLQELDNAALFEALHRVYEAAQSDARRSAGKRVAAETTTDRAGLGSIVIWIATAVLAGAVIMVLELAAFRLYAPYFGYSIYVWGAMISVVMVALAIGYALGGWMADRSRTDRALYVTILIGAAYQLAIVSCVRWLLPAMAQLGESAGTFLTTLLIFVVPMSCLATAGPFVIRLLSRSGRTGITAGAVYGVSTLGSVAGVLLTSFVFVPKLGTHATLCLACGTTAALGVLGLARGRRRALLAILPFALLPFTPDVAWGRNALWVGESVYNLIRVQRDGEELKLILNDESSVASRVNEISGWTGGYYDDFSLGPWLVPGRRALSLGMGAGASIIAARASAPELGFDAVEIDPMVVEAAHRFFGLKRDDPDTRIHVADARPWLLRSRARYDLVHVDLYQGGPYIPFYLVTTEFFELVRGRMSDDGLLMMNVLDASPGRALVRSTGATLRGVFPSVHVLSRANGNHMVFAFKKFRRLDDVRAALAQVSGNSKCEAHARRAAQEIFSMKPAAGDVVFTDDHAPIAEITKRMLAESRASARTRAFSK